MTAGIEPVLSSLAGSRNRHRFVFVDVFEVRHASGFLYPYFGQISSEMLRELFVNFVAAECD